MGSLWCVRLGWHTINVFFFSVYLFLSISIALVLWCVLCACLLYYYYFVLLPLPSVSHPMLDCLHIQTNYKQPKITNHLLKGPPNSQFEFHYSVYNLKFCCVVAVSTLGAFILIFVFFLLNWSLLQCRSVVFFCDTVHSFNNITLKNSIQ